MTSERVFCPSPCRCVSPVLLQLIYQNEMATQLIWPHSHSSRTRYYLILLLRIQICANRVVNFNLVTKALCLCWQRQQLNSIISIGLKLSIFPLLSKAAFLPSYKFWDCSIGVRDFPVPGLIEV